MKSAKLQAAILVPSSAFEERFCLLCLALNFVCSGLKLCNVLAEAGAMQPLPKLVIEVSRQLLWFTAILSLSL